MAGFNPATHHTRPRPRSHEEVFTRAPHANAPGHTGWIAWSSLAMTVFLGLGVYRAADQHYWCFGPGIVAGTSPCCTSLGPGVCGTGASGLDSTAGARAAAGTGRRRAPGSSASRRRRASDQPPPSALREADIGLARRRGLIWISVVLRSEQHLLGLQHGEQVRDAFATLDLGDAESLRRGVHFLRQVVFLLGEMRHAVERGLDRRRTNVDHCLAVIGDEFFLHALGGFEFAALKGAAVEDGLQQRSADAPGEVALD